MPSKIIITKREWEFLSGSSAESKSLDEPSAKMRNYCTHVPATDAARLENNDANTTMKQAKNDTQSTSQTKTYKPKDQPIGGPSDIPATGTANLKNNDVHATMKQAKTETQSTSQAKQAKVETQPIVGPSDTPTTETTLLKNNDVHTTTEQAKTETQPASRTKPAKAGTHPAGRPAKKPRKARDPNKPKHPISAYIYFTFAARPHLRACGMPMSGATLGELWRSLTAGERQLYEGMAADDNARYWREMAAYHASAGGRVNAVTPLPGTLSYADGDELETGTRV